ncbi:MAG: ABC transporter transmembrane domain-containing protein [Pseudomonadota bacterium]
MTRTADDAATGSRDARMVVTTPLWLMGRYVLRYPRMLALAGTALVSSAVITLAFPIGVRGVVDYGFGGAGDGGAVSGDIDFYFLLIALLGLAIAGTSALRFYAVTWIGERVVADLRVDVFANLAKLSPGFFEKLQSGVVVSRLTADSTQIKTAASTVVSQSLRNALLFVGGLIMMIITAPGLAALLLFVIPAVVLPIVLFGRQVRARSRDAQDTLASASAYAQEHLSATRTMQAFNAADRVRDRYGDAVGDAFDAATRRTLARAILTGGAISVVFVSVVGILWLGATYVAAGEMSPGVLSQFVLYAIFAAAGLGNLSELWGELQQTAGAAERLIELLHAKSPVREPAEPVSLPTPLTGAVAFETVSFNYPTAPDTPILKGLSVAIAPGETVAIVGPSGSGKTTIFNLLLRFYDPKSGAVRLDGVNIRDVSLADLRSAVAIVPQDIQLFADTVRANLAYGAPDATEAALWQAAELADADTFIKALPNGLETVIGERGVTLSGGQRQRLALARALATKAPVLLLDEATSALDTQTEAHVQAALARIKGRRTTIVIAHRLATVQSADRIVVVDAGVVVQTGTHSQLLADGGLYSDLAATQLLSGPSDVITKTAAE